MSVQCPRCSSYNEGGALFCGQCGGSLGADDGARARRGAHSSRAAWIAITVIVAAAIGTLLVVLPEPEPEASGGRAAPASGIGTLPKLVRPRERTVSGSRSAQDDEAIVPRSEEPQPLPVAELRKLSDAALVVLELSGAQGARLSDTVGVVVTEDGAVLSRLRPLLGAANGVARLSGTRQPRREVLGVIHFDERSDTALLRIDAGGGNLAALPLLDLPGDQAFHAGDDVRVVNAMQVASSGRDLLEGRVVEPYAVALDGSEGILVSGLGAAPADTTIVVDAYGFVVGFFASEPKGVRDADRGSADRAARGRIVRSAHRHARHLDRQVSWSLLQLTQQLYSGTFEDLVQRAERAFRARSWSEAIDLYQAAIRQTQVESIDAPLVDAAMTRLRESYLQELGRLESAQRLSEAIELAGIAIDDFPRDPVLWWRLAEARLSAGLTREGIDALLEIRQLEPGSRVEARLERAYLALAASASSRGDERGNEAALIEGVQQLPGSGALHLELARLYHRWEAFDDAIRLYRAAAELDPSLASQIDVLLGKIDDVLKRRDAVILPISEAGPIRASVVLDGAFELPFIVDTGATHTTLPRSFAEQMGYDYERAERVRLSTAGGTISGRKIVLRSVDLSGYSVRNLDAIVLPEGVGLETGLLGLNFLQFFRYSVDASRGEFRLERR